MDYIVDVVVRVHTPNKKVARNYVERKLRGSYTKDITILDIGESTLVEGN